MNVGKSRLRQVLKLNVCVWSVGHSSHVNGDIVMLGESGAGRMCLNYAHVGGSVSALLSRVWERTFTKVQHCSRELSLRSRAL